MKFLLFNVVVAASLGYLLLGEDRNATVAPILSKIEAMTSVAVETATAAVADQKPVLPLEVDKVKPAKVEATMIEAGKPVSAAPEKPAMPARRAPPPINQDVAVAPAPPLAPQTPAAPTGEAKKIASADPAAAQRRAEVLGDASSVADPAETPQFMTPTERRRELARLAEDMELHFLDKVRN